MRQHGKPMHVTAPTTEPNPPDPTEAAIATLGGAKGMVRTQTAYQTALTVQVPRDLGKVRNAVIREAGFAGDGFFYAWTQKDRSKDKTVNGKFIPGESVVEGVSIDGAMILIRNWGNSVCDPVLEDETPTHWLLRATFIDLETGFTSARLFRQRKSQSTGKHDNERALDINFQIGQSKAIRNTVVRCIPEWLRAAALDTAKNAEAEKYKDVPYHSKRAINAYKTTHGVTQEQLEQKLERPVADWLPTDIVLLLAIFRGLKEGQTSVGQEFATDVPPPVEEKKSAPAAKEEEPKGYGEQPIEGEEDVADDFVEEGTESATPATAKTDPPAAAVVEKQEPKPAEKPADEKKKTKPTPGFEPPASTKKEDEKKS